MRMDAEQYLGLVVAMLAIKRRPELSEIDASNLTPAMRMAVIGSAAWLSTVARRLDARDATAAERVGDCGVVGESGRVLRRADFEAMGAMQAKQTWDNVNIPDRRQGDPGYVAPAWWHATGPGGMSGISQGTSAARAGLASSGVLDRDKDIT